MTKEIGDPYRAEIDAATSESWRDIIDQFDDANIYQTWAYEETRSGSRNVSHLVLKRGETAVAAAQVRIVRIPVLQAGIAYVRWGPLWRRKGEGVNADHFRYAVRALRDEYAGNRGLLLRLYPVIFNDDAHRLSDILGQEKFTCRENGKRDATILVDLTPDLTELRKGLNQKWRNCLNKAERCSLDLMEGTDDGLFQSFLELYRVLLDRKKFVEPNDINEFRAIQKALCENHKMKIMLCREGGQPCAGAIFSALGDTGVYLFGATNDAGMKNNGSYILQWKYLEWLKKNGRKTYDLNGINPEQNPGTFKFKEGLAGKNGRAVHFLGQFEACESRLSRWVVTAGESIRRYRRERTAKGS
jgi:lipid II:glycine glycyltransferase (peptidoglycan interpeptide bridge formation enzyme)